MSTTDIKDSSQRKVWPGSLAREDLVAVVAAERPRQAA